MSNRNLLLKFIKYDFKIDREKYNHIEDYDIEEKYQNIPNNMKQAISPIVSTFKDFNFIYSFAFKISSILKEKEEQKKSIEKGSIVFSNNSFFKALNKSQLVSRLKSNSLYK